MARHFKPLWTIPLLLLLFTPILASALMPATPAAAYDPNELSYGLYWFGLSGANQKFESGEINPFFDPANPTLIFAHGWQPTLSDTVPDFDYGSVDTAAAWINDGWNVGIFVWNQFSDENLVTDAEAKIWTPNGPRGMRWRDWDDYIDGYGNAPPGTPSAAELFYQEYVAAMTEHPYTGGVIRIAGHSLGNQMATRMTKLVHDGIALGEVPEHLRPTRVALLDPYWSPGGKSYLGGETTGDIIREYIAELLPTGTLFEWYWSSNWTVEPDGDSNNDLKPMVLYAEMDPDYAASDKDKHMAAQHLYLWSYAFDGPSACTGEACLGMDKLLAKMSDAQLAAVLRSDYAWAQNAGILTDTPEDDTYQHQLRPGAPYTVTQLAANPLVQTVGGVITVTATVNDQSGPAGDGTQVTFSSDLGTISPRSVTSGGVAIAHITSDTPGEAQISATTRGTGGPAQNTVGVSFGGCPAPLTGAGIDGPLGVTGTLYINTLYTFDAVITPTNASPPITYTWSPIPVNGQNHPSATYEWSVSGTYTVTLTAENCGGPVDAAPRAVYIAHQEYTYLPLIMRNH